MELGLCSVCGMCAAPLGVCVFVWLVGGLAAVATVALIVFKIGAMRHR